MELTSGRKANRVTISIVLCMIVKCNLVPFVKATAVSPSLLEPSLLRSSFSCLPTSLLAHPYPFFDI